MVKRSLWLVVMSLVGAGIVLPSAAAGGGCHPPERLRLTSSSKKDVAISDCAFQDTVTYVDAGSKVTWVNADQVPHTVTGAAGSWGNEDYMALGDDVTYTFAKPGVFPYYCALHPSMVGVVVVGDAPRTDAAEDPGITELKDAAAAPTSAREPASDTGGGSSDLELVGLGAIGLLGATALASRRARRRRASR